MLEAGIFCASIHKNVGRVKINAAVSIKAKIDFTIIHELRPLHFYFKCCSCVLGGGST